MKKEVLEKLLEKYYNGSCTAEEENDLKKYFSGNDIPEAYKDEKEIFRYFSEMAGIPVPAKDFENKIISVIERQTRSSFARKKITLILSIAACILALAGFIFFFSGKHSEDTYKDPRIAYIQTMKILSNISLKMNEGASKLEPVTRLKFAGKTIDVVNASFEKAQKQLNNMKERIEVKDENLKKIKSKTN